MNITNFDDAIIYLAQNGFEAKKRTIAGAECVIILHNAQPAILSSPDILIYEKSMYIWSDPDNVGKWLVEVESTVPHPKFEQTDTLKEACDMVMDLLNKEGNDTTL